jgi:hypothetical protein
MAREYAIHARVPMVGPLCGARTVWRYVGEYAIHARVPMVGPLCGARTVWRYVGTADDTPTCRRCLYRLGLYVPLVKLREHQAESRRIWKHTNTW